MAHKELIDTRTARELLGIGPSTLAMLIERDDLGDTYWWSPTRNQKRILLDRDRVEVMAADSNGSRRKTLCSTRKEADCEGQGVKRGRFREGSSHG